MIAIMTPQELIKIKTGKKITKYPFFALGSGMAPGNNERYDTAFVTNFGFHYLTYENSKNKRVDLISDYKDLLQLEWKIMAFNYKKINYSINNSPLNALMFVILIDANLNGIIDKGELHIVKVIFK